MKRTPLIAANWKMHAPPPGWDADNSPYRSRDGIDVVIFPNFLDIHTCVEHFLVTGAQYGRPEETGAFTGDVSMQLIAAHGCTYVLCGHSERRQHHEENDALIASEVEAAVHAGLTPILCIGETSDERELGQTKEVIERQLLSILQFPVSNLTSLIIAYEPVWAIGSGKSATGAQAEEIHTFIRSLLPESVRTKVRILYGGSVKPENAAEFFAQENIDGALVGGSSLDPAAFESIVNSYTL